MRSKHQNNANEWNAVYRVSTERALLKNLREWDNSAWWGTQYLRWRVRKTWDTMVSVVEKLISEDALCHIFILENLKLKFYEVKAEIEQPKKKKTR